MSERESVSWGPYLIVLVGTVLSLALILMGVPPVVGVPSGGAFLLLGAALRMFLPDRSAGWLATRDKTTDTVTLGLLGALLLFGGLILLVPRDWIIIG